LIQIYAHFQRILMPFCLLVVQTSTKQNLSGRGNSYSTSRQAFSESRVISGGLIIALALMVGITVYWKKFWGKQPLNEGQELQFRERQPLNEIMEATQNFSQEIGRTGFGSVFFGKLPDGKEIAVKVFCNMVQANEKFLNDVFLNEIDLLSRVHHKNLVTLLGYCIGESGQHMLIYDHLSEGSLRDHLYGQRAGLSKLDWKSRLKIAIDAAEGLQYLHVCCTPMIIHRDVKSTNIILDSDLNGKLGDFGLSMMTMDRKAPIDTLVAGTYGYADPEYVMSGVLTQKSDVYSFGVVLLEIICGRKPIDRTLPEEEKSLPEWVRNYVGIKENPVKIVEIIDKKMDGNYDMKSITIVAKLALRCIEETSSWRPSMSEVVGELKEAFMYEKVKLKEAPVAKHK